MNVLITALKNYNPINDKKVKSKKEVLKNSEILHIIRNKIIKTFKDGTFLLSKESVHKNKAKADDKNDEDDEDDEEIDTTDTPH